MLGSQLQTVPVVLEEQDFQGSYAILFARSEGMSTEVLTCRTEDEADRYMKEYERSGTLSFPKDIIRAMDISTPVFMVKTKAERALRVEYRAIQVEDPNIIDPEEIMSSEVNE